MRLGGLRRGDLPSGFVRSGGLELRPEGLEGRGGDMQGPRVGIALLDALPSECFGAIEAVEYRRSSVRRDHFADFLSLATLPEIEVKDNVPAEVHTLWPEGVDQGRYALEKIREAIPRRILAVDDRHPFVMRKAQGRKLTLQMPGKSCLARPEGAANHVNRRHAASIAFVASLRDPHKLDLRLAPASFERHDPL